MLNVKEVTEENGSVFLAHVDKNMIYPLIGLCAAPGCTFNYPDTAAFTMTDSHTVKNYDKDIDYVKDFWQYVFPHEPHMVTNRHLLFSESTYSLVKE